MDGLDSSNSQRKIDRSCDEMIISMLMMVKIERPYIEDIKNCYTTVLSQVISLRF